MPELKDFTGIEKAAAKELEAFNKMHGVADIKDSPILRGVEKLRATMESARLEMQHSAMNISQRGELNAKIREAARAEIVRLVGAEKERLAGEVAAEKARIARERTLHRDTLDRTAREASIRFSAMSSAELAAESMRILNSGEPVEPVILDLLSSELRSQNPQAHGFFREHAAKTKLYETDRYTETGKKLHRSLEALSGYDTGDYVPAEHLDGSFTPIPLGEALGEV